MSEPKTFQQVIEGWRERGKQLNHSYECLRIQVDGKHFLVCADEASLVLERLRAHIRWMRKQATDLELAHGGDPRGELLGIIGQLRRDADALELICGPIEENGHEQKASS